MSDIATRLRNKSGGYLLDEAADEIERLEALHLKRTKSTHKALVERDTEIERLTAENERLRDALDRESYIKSGGE